MSIPGETATRSALDKPLGELTEEDIAQLTREDCRRFLREKGMRRPSWNKSQAIQQVISLKALLESRPDSCDPATAGIHQKPPPPPPPLLPSPPPPPPPPPLAAAVPSTRREVCGSDLQAAVASVKDPLPTTYRRRDPAPPASPAGGDAPCRFPAAETDPLSPESISLSHRFLSLPLSSFTNLGRGAESSLRAAAEAPAGQLTIFYGGRVNVYDDVPPDKARAIMQLAASRGFDDAPAEPGPSSLSLPCRFVPGCLGPGLVPAAAPFTGPFPAATPGKLPSPFRESASEWRAPRETETEGPTSRKASLQRYKEKRKDRFKGKRVIGVSSPSIMEMMYLGQKLRDQTTNEQSSRSDVSSPTQPRPPCTPTRCSSIENKVPKFGISIDLNEEGIEEP